MLMYLILVIRVRDEIVFRWVNLGELDYIFYINIDEYCDNIIINFFLMYKSNFYI